MLPSSSRVKKVLQWNSVNQAFEMDPHHKNELQQQQITDEAQWKEFESFFTGLEPADHPSNRRPSCCKGTFLFLVSFIFLVALLYVFFIILQLALFNLILLVVMLNWWWKVCKVFQALINRVLDNGRKKPFK